MMEFQRLKINLDNEKCNFVVGCDKKAQLENLQAKALKKYRE